MSKLLMLIIPLLDKGIKMVIDSVNTDEKDDKLIKFLSYSIVYWQDELRLLVEKSETEIDDLLIEEAIQAAMTLSE